MSSVVDTNIAINKLRGLLDDPLLEGKVLVSVFTKIELLSFPGITVLEEAEIQALIANFTIVPFEQQVKDETIRLRRTMRLRLPDAIVLATAVVTRAELLTNDRELAAKASAIVPCRSIAMHPLP